MQWQLRSLNVIRKFLRPILPAMIALSFVAAPSRVQADPPNYEAVLTLLQTAGSPSVDDAAKAISALGAYRYQEVVAKLLAVLHTELQYGMQSADNMQPGLLRASLDSLSKLCNAEWVGELRELRSFAVMSFAGRADAKLAFAENVLRIEAAAKERTAPMPYLISEISGAIDAGDPAALLAKEQLLDMIPMPDLSLGAGSPEDYALPADEAVRAKLEALRVYLEGRIKGQPDVIERLLYFRTRELLYRNGRNKNEILMLMGTPGTGKDTSVEAYVDGVSGYKEGAYKENLFTIDIPQGQEDLWKILGSKPGFVGSQYVAAFLRYLVGRSGGKYYIEKKQGATEEHIYLNPDWIPNNDRAYVFLNEFHLWPKKFKDILLQVPLEKNRFPVGNPGDGVGFIEVPTTWLIASNDGMGLYSSQDLDGARYGNPMSADEMLARQQRASANPELLRRELETSGASANAGARAEDMLGYSPPLLSRLCADPRSVMLMRPLFGDTLQDIVTIELLRLREAWKDPSNPLGTIELDWNGDLVKFIQEYKSVAENGARPIPGRVKALVESTLVTAVQNGVIRASPSGEQQLVLSIRQNEDKTASLVVRSSATGEAVLPIELTQADKALREMSDEEIASYAAMAERMNARVIGINSIADALARAALLADEATKGPLDSLTSKARAQIFVFFGPSGTGKTELAKAFTEASTGNEKDLWVLDFNQITVHDIPLLLTGTRDAGGKPIASEFMKRFKRNDGEVYMLMNEFSNAPWEVKRAFYAFLDEAVVTTYSDGVPRPNGKVRVIIDGNAGEEWYENIPSNIPLEEQMEARNGVYTESLKDPGLLRVTLERYFPEALLNRFPRVFWFPPGNLQSVRELSQLKLSQAIASLDKGADSRKGWDVAFQNDATARAYLDLIGNYGYRVKQEGRSINDFVKQQLEERIRETLLVNGVSSGTKVTLLAPQIPAERVRNFREVPDPIRITMMVEGRAPLSYSIQPEEKQREALITEEQRIETDAHEAGHETVRHGAFDDKYTPRFIKGTPGVGNFGGQWLRYLGVASSDETIYVTKNREAVVREIAVLAGGETAQRLITVGARHDEGKGNDMQRATDYARTAILKWGVSEAWGTQAAPGGVSLIDYISSLSENKKRLLEKEVDALVEEGRKMAEDILIANYDTVLVPMTHALAEKGQLEQVEIEKFYTSDFVDADHANSLSVRLRPSNILLRARLAWSASVPYLFRRTPVDSEFAPHFPMPASVANPAELLQDKKASVAANLPLSEELPIRGEGDDALGSVCSEDLHRKR